MKIKLQPGDCVDISNSTTVQYFAIIEKFNRAINQNNIYATGREWNYIGWSKEYNEIRHSNNMNFCFDLCRLLTIDQVLNSSQEEEEMQEEKYVPVVGDEVQVLLDCGWVSARLITITERSVFYSYKYAGGIFEASSYKLDIDFRKIKTGREIFIDEAYQATSDNFKHSDLDQLLTELYDAGFKGPNQ